MLCHQSKARSTRWARKVCVLRLTNSKHGGDQDMSEQEQCTKEGGAEVGPQGTEPEETSGRDHIVERVLAR